MKRSGTVAMGAVVALVIGAGIVAYAGTDPTQLDCNGGYQSVGFSMASDESYHPTPEQAAAAFAAEIELNSGEQLDPADIELADVTSATRAASEDDTRVISVGVDGRTVLLLAVDHGAGGWAVTKDVSC